MDNNSRNSREDMDLGTSPKDGLDDPREVLFELRVDDRDSLLPRRPDLRGLREPPPPDPPPLLRCEERREVERPETTLLELLATDKSPVLDRRRASRRRETVSSCGVLEEDDDLRLERRCC